MLCDRCGQSRAEPGGRGCTCSWIARETLYGRWSLLSLRRRSALIGLGVLLFAGAASLVVLLTGADETSSDASSDAAAVDDLPRPHDAPSLTLPTAVPGGEPGSTTYSAWTGPGCEIPKGGGYRESGRFWDGHKGWYTVDSGGYRGVSCDGSFAAVPMAKAGAGAGSGSGPEGRQRAMWWWSVGEGAGECTIRVYVPSSPEERDVAGRPTSYQVLNDPDDLGSKFAAFQIDQTANRGRLVKVGTYRVSGSLLAVDLLDGAGGEGGESGERRGGGPRYAHHAAAQIEATCRAL